MERGPHLSRATTARKPLFTAPYHAPFLLPFLPNRNSTLLLLLLLSLLSLFEKNVVIVEKMEKFQRGENRNQEAKE